MTLEHYPGMTEAELARIEAEAQARWPLQASLIVHRVGELKPGDNIVLVVTASAHRQAAFEAAGFLMDYLKTRAPFWKKEISAVRRQRLGRGPQERRECRQALELSAPACAATCLCIPNSGVSKALRVGGR